MSFIKKVCILALLVLMTWAGLIFYSGWQMYEAALADCPLEEKVQEVTAQPHFTTLDQLPQVYLDAVLAVEDRSFYHHHGFSFRATGRAVIRNFQEGELAEGGSTITQQLAKIWYFDLNKKFDRKVAELLMAFHIEKDYEKKEILEFYLNSIYFGSGYYNVYDASMGYFGKVPSEMNDYEATMLAGIPNAPSVYSPDVNPDLAEQRRQQVIQCMEQYGYIEKGAIQ
ncbi:MAG: transglycosylase domain-containing protein [Firmicutes bacterium]|nr:transglycosylase domain-containing protein [Bacillota bacterium]MDY5856863.1 transglycosylase domain-containing protein [Anaerovoracaceae bacterium]